MATCDEDYHLRREPPRLVAPPPIGAYLPLLPIQVNPTPPPPGAEGDVAEIVTLGLNPRGTDIRREGVGGHTDLPAEVALQHGAEAKLTAV
jgi:hypothetical protein